MNGKIKVETYWSDIETNVKTTLYSTSFLLLSIFSFIITIII